ncbi:MAG: hypothetical protein WC876_05270 [Candidatus Thermoplasmatota archaeon]|jgi:hypothetical protein
MVALRTLTLLPMLLLALPGCIGDSGGSATVSYDGTGNGTDTDRTSCNDDGTLVSSGQVDAGQVDVRVTDGDGRTVFTQQFDGGANLDAQAIQGADGTWTLTASRSSDTILGSPFSGHYSFRLSC